MAVIKNAKIDGAKLIAELVKTGTADAKLALPRHVLEFIWRSEKRRATAQELIEAMEKAGVMEPYLAWPPTPPLTLQKAIALATTGAWAGPVEVRTPHIEELLLAGQDVPPAPEVPAAERAVNPPAAEPQTLKDAVAPGPRPRGRPRLTPAVEPEPQIGAPAEPVGA